MEYRKYEVWHDESKVGGYHHGVLFVPVDKKNALIDLLKAIRKGHSISCEYPMKFAGTLRKKTKGRYIHSNLLLFSHIIKTQKIGITKLINITGKHEKKQG